MLIERWDRQQERYIREREARFDTLLTAVEWIAERRGTSQVQVVDLGCGPGAIGSRLLRRLPAATYTGVDVDPVLLELARRAAADHPAGSFRVVDADMAGDAWLEHVPTGGVDVVCSSTALHWLSPERLEAALRTARRCLAPGGALLNADHLAHPGADFQELAAWVDHRDQAAAGAAGAPDWDTWWGEVRDDATLRPLCDRRDEVFPPDEEREGGRPSLEGFVAAARTAGFAHVDTIWQRFDDRIVMALE